MAAGGGGGSAATTNSGATGGTTSFASWTVIGGTLGNISGVGGLGGSGGVDSTGTLIVRFKGGDGGSSGLSAGLFSGAGGNNPFGGAANGVFNATNGRTASANTGGGGNGAASGAGTNPGSGGGAGEYVEFYITSPISQYTYTVGAGGVGGAAGTNAGGTGAAGVIEVEEYYLATDNLVSTTAGTTQYTETLNFVVKVTPDTSTSIATGVYSIGGMTGVITCGSGLLCTGNVISVNASTFAGGADTNIQFNSFGLFAGSSNYNFISPDTVTLGAVGTTGKFDIYGTTSGHVRQTVQATAGTPTITWGNTSGTPAISANTPLILSSTTGAISCPTCLNNTPAALTRVDDTNVTLTLGGTPTTALLQATSLTLGWNGQLPVTRGGTGLAVGTSGGIPYFSSTTNISSSSLLTANQIMIGGGAGTAPSTFTCATTTTVVHGGTPPTCGQIVNADITTNTISNDRLNTIDAVTLKGNPTNASATPVDFTIASLTQTVSPNSTNDMMLIWDSAAGTFKKITTGTIASSSVAGVSSVNALTGAVTITGSAGIVTNTGAGTITITPDTATAANFEAGTAAKMLDAAVVFTSETTTTYGATTALDFNTFINSKVTLTGNTTLTCSNIKAGQAGQIRLIQDGTGTRVITPNSAAGWCSQFRFASATIPTLTTSASAVDILNFSCSSTTYCQAGLAKGFNP